jgi:nitrous oxidase accessory protein NosD
MPRAFVSSALGACAVLLSISSAQAATLRVPAQYPTIQAAIDAAAPGDRIRVARGRHCGATLTKPVVLEGRGSPRIIGCSTSPMVTTGLRAGFYLPGGKGSNAASGSSIVGFVFDGKGVSNANLEPLSFGVFARSASDVTVRNNRIRDLTVLDCTRHCTGGDGIVIALARGAVAAPGGDAEPLNRPEDNVIVGNTVEGSPPDGFGVFSMVGVLLLSADHTTILENTLKLRDNPNASSVGQGILVSNTCCGLASSFLPGSRFASLIRNDARQSETGIVVEGSGGANTFGLFLHRNRGDAVIEGNAALALAARRVGGQVRAQPLL